MRLLPRRLLLQQQRPRQPRQQHPRGRTGFWEILRYPQLTVRIAWSCADGLLSGRAMTRESPPSTRSLPMQSAPGEMPGKDTSVATADTSVATASLCPISRVHAVCQLLAYLLSASVAQYLASTLFVNYLRTCSLRLLRKCPRLLCQLLAHGEGEEEDGFSHSQSLALCLVVCRRSSPAGTTAWRWGLIHCGQSTLGPSRRTRLLPRSRRLLRRLPSLSWAVSITLKTMNLIKMAFGART